MDLEAGMVVGVKPEKAYYAAVRATTDCSGEALCPSGEIPQGCQDPGHLLMVVAQRPDGWALCPLSGFPHASANDLPKPEYIRLGEADIIRHPTYLHVGLLTVVEAKFIVPRPHPKDSKAKASFRGERREYLLNKVLKHWAKKDHNPSDGAIKSLKA